MNEKICMHVFKAKAHLIQTMLCREMHLTLHLMHSPVNTDTCGHFPWMPVSVGMLHGTWSTPLTQHIAETRQNAAGEFHTRVIKMHFYYLSVCLRGNSCAFRRFFHRGFLFSTGLGDLCSHASGATKGPNRSNDWTKTASFLPKIQVECRHLLLQPKPRSKPETEITAKGRVRTRKMFQRCRSNANSFNFFLRGEFVNGEIGPAANEMRSTTPKSTDEWALGLWRQSHPVSTNHKSQIQRVGWWWWWGGVMELGERGEGHGQ